jgi:hypothetical protein
MLVHVPFWVKKFGDLNVFATQGIEHGHLERKRVVLHSTNGQRAGFTANGKSRSTRVMQAMRVVQTNRIAVRAEPDLARIRGGKSKVLDMDMVITQ